MSTTTQKSINNQINQISSKEGEKDMENCLCGKIVKKDDLCKDCESQIEYWLDWLDCFKLDSDKLDDKDIPNKMRNYIKEVYIKLYEGGEE